MNTRNAFGLWLKEKMAERGVQQAELAALIDVVPSVVSRWVNGDALPRSQNCRKIAEALHIPLDEVLRRAGHPVASDTPAPAPARSPA